MTIGSGIAVVAIWGAVALTAYANPGGDGNAVCCVAVMALIATLGVVITSKK
ncbi:MAG: hypothetical protein KGI60_00675 [Patescibacteria group bacterium]|nr:hypothetical protein [Patescibacteria group bacterium]